MPANPTLAEILAEAERLERELVEAQQDSMFTTADRLRGAILDFQDNHCPRLVAVARAADRLRDYTRHAPICTGDSTRPCDCGLVEAAARFDALASGAAAPEAPR